MDDKFFTCISLAAELLILSNSPLRGVSYSPTLRAGSYPPLLRVVSYSVLRCVSLTLSPSVSVLWPFTDPFNMVPFSVGPGPQRGCHIAPPEKPNHLRHYIRSDLVIYLLPPAQESPSSSLYEASSSSSIKNMLDPPTNKKCHPPIPNTLSIIMYSYESFPLFGFKFSTYINTPFWKLSRYLNVIS